MIVRGCADNWRKSSAQQVQRSWDETWQRSWVVPWVGEAQSLRAL